MIPRAMLVVAYATDRASHARQGDDPDKKGYPGPPGWGLGVRVATSHRKKISLRNLKRRPRPTQGCRADDEDDDDDDDDDDDFITARFSETKILNIKCVFRFSLQLCLKYFSF
jgi:hypothetical protein